MGWGEVGGGWGCNRVHLHIVFVFLYSVCHSVHVTSISFFCVWTSCHCIIILLRAIILDVTKRHRESARKSGRRHQLPLVHAIGKNNNKKKKKTTTEEPLAGVRLLSTSNLLVSSFRRPHTVKRITAHSTENDASTGH